ncbi:MAG: 4-hydroxy-3-methylbut-2-enyl diphosphate reductase [Lentimicrobiaceae bacterium]
MAVINIDPHAGFCPGVKKAILSVDKLLHESLNLYSLGELVHCPEEIERLETLGLKVITDVEIPKLTNASVLIRAHGVNPETQQLLHNSGNNIIDATCSIVKRLQQKVKLCSIQMLPKNGQVVIFGKKNHPEVIGLLGYCQGRSVVVENSTDLSSIDLSVPLCIFAQTTSNVTDYEEFVKYLFIKFKERDIPTNQVQVINSICGSMKKRVPELINFAEQNDVVIFVSGRQSSNGAYLASVCTKVNSNTYRVSGIDELKSEWFHNAKSIGITGATSTPVWLLEKVSAEIKLFLQQRLCSEDEN